MRLFPKLPRADAMAYAAGGGQALHLAGVTPGRIYDQNLPRLVRTVRELGQRDVRVARTGTEHQHAEIRGFPLVRACIEAGEANNVLVIDILSAVQRQAVAS